MAKQNDPAMFSADILLNLTTPSNERRYMTSEIASQFGVSKKTILNWLKTGKIPEPARNPVTNYRIWTDTDLAMIRRALDKEAYDPAGHR
jgi:MerR HTH family regulatory protein